MTAQARRPALRLAAVGLFLVLPLAALLLLAANLLQWREAADLAARQEALLAQLDARLARAVAPDAPKVDVGAIYLAATTRALAGADLQQRLRGAVEMAGGTLIETRQEESDAAAAADSVRVRVTLDIRNAGLIDLLYGLETGLPLLVVDGFSVRRLPAGEGADPNDPPLRVDLAVRGHFRVAS